MSFVKLGHTIFNTDHIITVEKMDNRCCITFVDGNTNRVSVSIEDALKALGPSLICIGGMYLDPDEVLAVSAFTDAQNCVVKDKALIWLGPDGTETGPGRLRFFLRGSGPVATRLPRGTTTRLPPSSTPTFRGPGPRDTIRTMPRWPWYGMWRAACLA